MKKINLYIFLIVFLITCSAFLLPNHHVPWRTAYQDFLTYAVFLILTLKILINYRNIIIDWKIILVFLISFIPLVQYIFGKIYFFGDAFIAFIYVLSFGVAILIGCNLRRNIEIEKIMLFISSILISSCLISIYFCLSQWLLIADNNFWIEKVDIGARPYANFGQPNNFASFLLIGLLATVYLYEKKIINLFSIVLLSSLIIFCISLTQSRTTWLYGIFFVIWWLWKSRNFNTRLNKYSSICFFVILILSSISISYISSAVDILPVNDLVTRATTGYLRLPMWYQMILAIWDQPWFGYGWNQVSVAQISIFKEYPITGWIEHSHNIILDLVIWNGIPLGIFISVFYIYWLWQLSKLAVSIENFIILSMMGVLLVHGNLEFPLEYAYFLLPFGLFLGLVHYDNKINFIRFSSRLGLYFLGGFVVVYTWIFVEYKIIEKEVELARFSALGVNSLDMESNIDSIVLLTQLKENVINLRTLPRENMSDEQMDLMRDIAYRYGTSSNLYRYALALAFNDQHTSAKHYLEILNELHKKDENLNSLYFLKDSLNSQQ